ncbi:MULTISPECIES: 3'-5' exonuclease [unclassified Acinetobacter]|uniref:3'-5' exonuclease n=1 Tax=unclassified Acinetobacter TaxID=196816 RepID=UPI0015D1BAC4|nr:MULTISPECIES: 3'-5' exonuclease [unclassified Acinetobacter]
MDLTRLRTLPSPDEIRQLPLFENIARQNIVLIQNLEQCLAIEAELKTAAVLGFDSESKPTFNVGEVSTGPHLIQLATLEKAYLFQLNDDIWQFLQPVFANRDQIKVGFGLKNDAHLFRKKGIQLNSVIELSKCFGSFGFKSPLGLKNAMALLFHVHFPKSRSISTSNWARQSLSEAQIAYAAADAYAPVLIFEELGRLGLLPEHIPNSSLKLRIRPSKTKPTTDA